MKGYKTYTGLIISALGLLGISSYFSETEVAQIADLIIQVIGLVYAWYGRYKATKTAIID